MSQIFSHGLLPGPSESASAEVFLRAAVDHWEDAQVSDHYIQSALAAEFDLDVLVSAYRYYFYRSNAPMALQMATSICNAIRQTEHWPDDWTQLQPLLRSQIETPSARLYLNAYGAVGLLQARLGNLTLAATIAHQLQQLQAKEFGADVLLGILNPPPEED